jgi:hypothetical protein
VRFSVKAIRMDGIRSKSAFSAKVWHEAPTKKQVSRAGYLTRFSNPPMYNLTYTTAGMSDLQKRGKRCNDAYKNQFKSARICTLYSFVHDLEHAFFTFK